MACKICLKALWNAIARIFPKTPTLCCGTQAQEAHVLMCLWQFCRPTAMTGFQVSVPSLPISAHKQLTPQRRNFEKSTEKMMVQWGIMQTEKYTLDRHHWGHEDLCRCPVPPALLLIRIGFSTALRLRGGAPASDDRTYGTPKADC